MKDYNKKNFWYIFEELEVVGYLRVLDSDFLASIGDKYRQYEFLCYLLDIYLNGEVNPAPFYVDMDNHEIFHNKIPNKIRLLRASIDPSLPLPSCLSKMALNFLQPNKRKERSQEYFKQRKERTKERLKKEEIQAQNTFKGFKLNIRKYNRDTLIQLYRVLANNEVIKEELTSEEDFVAILLNENKERKIHIANTTVFAFIHDYALKELFKGLTLEDLEASQQFITANGKNLTAVNMSSQKSKAKNNGSKSKEDALRMINEEISNFLLEKK